MASDLLKPGTEVYISSPWADSRSAQRLAALDRTLGSLADDAGGDRALILADDSNRPEGEWHSSLQVIE